MNTVKHHVPLLSGAPGANPGNISKIVSIVTLVSALWSFFCAVRSKQRGRRALRNMSDQQLYDIGISRVEADVEGARRFWE